MKLNLFTLVTLIASTFAIPVGEKPENANLRRISTKEGESQWMTEDEIAVLIRDVIPFIDLTDEVPTNNFRPAPRPIRANPSTPTQQSLVKPLTEQIDLQQMKDFLTTFSTFNNRYYKSTSGKESSIWLQGQLEAVAKYSNSTSVKVEIVPFTHPSFAQKSLIAKIIPTQPINAGRTIVGAHQDSINGQNALNGRAPGADDDGSGTGSIFEAFRLLVVNNYVPKKTLEFHFYAAEEAGLLGSQAIAVKYKSDNVIVDGMLQVDMTGYVKPGTTEVIGIETSRYADTSISTFLKTLSAEYAAIPGVSTSCGYACSDHASWTKNGYKAAFLFESLFENHNKQIHTANDSLEKVSFSHMAEFTKLILGWAVEMTA
ncbi:Leucine aminopeptidase 1 [Clydaea vesicula]|uniref:Peptide hydrolase n=1 Tax=Clydaea vesicula TaxID=447962 RepID=A0AAD5U329_9FUNG|nr:Leucine aminopeptidase 1 [Clydaea vesicula]KAJ3397912.1 Leucine aminopeptidase 1 [Lobulomyces angularis]